MVDEDLPLHKYVTEVLGVEDDGKDIATEDTYLVEPLEEFIDIRDLLEEADALMQSLNISSDENIDGNWLRNQLSHLPPNTVEHVFQLLESSRDPDNELLDLLGYDNVELVVKIIEHKQSILRDSKFALAAPPVVANLKSERYPHVYGSPSVPSADARYALPEGTTHLNEASYEEFCIPPSEHGLEQAQAFKLVSITALQDEILTKAFPSYTNLNRMQSIVFPAAYHSRENLLISAPTGAGKTDVALLTVLKCIRENMLRDKQFTPFKVVYVAPMKALAVEIVAKFSSRLKSFGIQVRECTGDTQLTHAEMKRTHVIVTTPEKWDVITRKAEGELVDTVQLLIIDEVHLLHDQRGAVLESIIARTLRQVEMRQRMIRIVGLSATLPNFQDVAAFLRVNPYSGMFFFDGSFRPVPLTQSFIGIKGRNPRTTRDSTTLVCYQKTVEFVKQGHQVMVFVHSRNDTVKTARDLLRLAGEYGTRGLFSAKEIKGFEQAVRSINKTRNHDLRDLFETGFGIHHAGMARHDRLLSERLFESGHIRVLCCTATLAWGVNLPAHAVIIKGTLVYDSNQGGFVNLGVLDVLQIFGRAGRPQYESHGTGILITSHEQLFRYINAITCQTPIESHFVQHLANNMNAEIVLGTVSNLEEAAQWLHYTFLYIRMMRNPSGYGLTPKEIAKDPNLRDHMHSIIRSKAIILRNAGMIVFDDPHGVGHMKAMNAGRIASLLYITVETMEMFREKLHPRLTEEDIIGVVGMASEFANIKTREEELPELTALLEEVPMRVLPNDSLTSYASKVNLLLQASISRRSLESFSLQSDSNYVEQNAGRVLRAIFEIVRGHAWSQVAMRALNLCISFERKLWSSHHPLAQFEGLILNDTLSKLQERKLTLERLQDEDLGALGEMIRDHRAAPTISKALSRFPQISLGAQVLPVGSNVLKIVVTVTPSFVWDCTYHGASEGWWICIESSDNLQMLGCEYLHVTPKQLGIERQFSFHIPAQERDQVTVRAVSDRWLNCQRVEILRLDRISMPRDRFPAPPTELLPLRPLPIIALNNPILEDLYTSRNILHFNSVQTQTFHTLYHKQSSVLIGAPTGSGKTLLAELALWNALRAFPGRRVVYIAPLKALVRERILDWQERFSRIGVKVVALWGDEVTPSAKVLNTSHIFVTTPEKWDSVSRQWPTRAFIQQVSLVVIDEIHLLASEQRGHVIEAIVMRMQRISKDLRMIGLSTALSTAGDMAAWMSGSKDFVLYNFRPSVRPVPVEVRIESFSGIHYCPRMASMNKPAYQAILRLSSDKPVLIFVSSRRQTRLTALDLISLVSLDGQPRRWITRDIDEVSWGEQVVSQAEDPALCHCLAFGIALHHAGLSDSDRSLSERLFSGRLVQVLVATSTLAWGVNFPAHLVIIKGTEYWDAKQGGYTDAPLTDILQMIGRAGRPQFDTSAKAVLMVHDSKRAFYRKFLYESFPVESSLAANLTDHLMAEITAGTMNTMVDAMDWLQTSYLHYRLQSNPDYYKLRSISDSEFMSTLLMKCLKELAESSCINVIYAPTEDQSMTLQDFSITNPQQFSFVKASPTPFGRIASFYYLSHSTIRSFLASLSIKIESVGAPDFGVTIDSLDTIYRQLALSTEYSMVPVRHNEDVEMMQWLKSIRQIPFTDPMFALPALSPNFKTFVLLRSHILNLELPIPDFYTDTRSILDQAYRILAAFVDVCVERRDLGMAISTVHVMQELHSSKRLNQHAEIYKEIPREWPRLQVKRQNETVSLTDLHGISGDFGWHCFSVKDGLLRDYKRLKHHSRMQLACPQDTNTLFMSDHFIGIDVFI